MRQLSETKPFETSDCVALACIMYYIALGKSRIPRDPKSAKCPATGTSRNIYMKMHRRNEIDHLHTRVQSVRVTASGTCHLLINRKTPGKQFSTSARNTVTLPCFLLILGGSKISFVDVFNLMIFENTDFLALLLRVAILTSLF